MKIGVFTALLGQLPFDQLLDKLHSLDIHTVELGAGNYPGDPHCPRSLLTDRNAFREFKGKLEDRGFSISALSCHGNSLHPNPALAKAFHETSRRTIRLAEKLGVPVVIDFSGCPGDSNAARYPNWITCPWPPEYLEVLDWQWEKKVAPFWTRHAEFARDHGVTIAIEMHPGFV
ncbi:MAG: sugar phosphate isomerase/epimerase, partial [Bryobacterales bacterium]|nr:sugar phosphate isomerase/epimerase [Bryobacterales bacterium]